MSALKPWLSSRLDALRGRPVLRKIGSDFLFQVALKLASFAFGLVALHFLAAALGPARYGVYALACGFVNLFKPFTEFQQRALVIRDVGAERLTLQQAGEAVLHMTLLFAPVVFVVMLLGGVLYAPEYLLYFALAGAAYFLVPANALTVVLICREKIKLSRIPQFLSVVLTAALFWLVLKPGSGVVAALLCILAAGAFRAVGEAYLVRKEIALRLRAHWPVVRRFFREGGVLVLCSLVGVLHVRADLFMLARYPLLHALAERLPFFPGGAALAPASYDHEAAMGFYAGAYRFLEMVRICPEYVLATSIPILARLKTPAEFETFARKVLLLLAGFAACVTVAYLAFGSFIVRAILGDDFRPSAGILLILAFGIPTLMVRPLFRRLIVLRRFEKHLVWITVVSLLLNLLANVYCIPLYGARGAAATTVFSETAYLLMVVWVCRKALRAWRAEVAESSPDAGEPPALSGE